MTTKTRLGNGGQQSTEGDHPLAGLVLVRTALFQPPQMAAPRRLRRTVSIVRRSYSGTMKSALRGTV